jgi:hypothetical protein
VIYKRLVSRIKEMILKVNKDYQYPASLASTIIEGALHQHYLKDHFKSITDCSTSVTPAQFFTDLTLTTLKTSTNG